MQAFRVNEPMLNELVAALLRGGRHLLRGDLLLVLELVEGITLAERLARCRRDGGAGLPAIPAREL